MPLPEDLLSDLTDQLTIKEVVSSGDIGDRHGHEELGSPPRDQNNKPEDLDNDVDLPGRDTNNLADDHLDRQTVAGASGERVVNLTGLVSKTCDQPYAGGGYSLVYKGAYRKLGKLREVVIKSPFPRDSWGDDGTMMRIKKRVSKELATWSKLKHPNIIELLGYIDGVDFESFVMDFCPGGPGTLTKRLEGLPRISQLGLLSMLLQFTSGLSHMHKLDIVHSDLKPENVLIGAMGEIKISDFGLSRIMKNVAPTSTSIVQGTWDYNSPELIGYNLTEGPVTTLSSDVWAFGVVAHQLLQHNVNPMPHAHQAASLFDRIRVKNEGHPPYPTEPRKSTNEIISYLIEQIAECWAADPNARPKMQNLTTQLHESLLTQDLQDKRWGWLFDNTGEHDSRANVVGGVSSKDSLRESNYEYQRGRYKESQGLRAKAAVAELFKGNLFECAEIQRELADCCAKQFERESMVRHYNSAIRKYESLGPSYFNLVSDCEQARDRALENCSPGAYERSPSPLDTSSKMRQIADKAETALGQNDFTGATKYFEELVDVARRGDRMDIVAQAYDGLARTCQYEARRRLVQAREHYTTALDCAKLAGVSAHQRIMEGNLKRLEVWSSDLEL